MKILKAIYDKLFGVSGAAHTGANPVILTDLYDGPDGWHFSYTKADHTDGGVWGPYLTQYEAEIMREQFVSRRSGTTSFVHQGTPYRPQSYYRQATVSTEVTIWHPVSEEVGTR